MFNIVFNNMSNSELGLVITKAPNIPLAEKNREAIEVPGRDGSLTKDYGTYKDITISISFSYVNLDFEDKAREIKRWITEIKDNKLKVNELDTFYKVKYVNLTEIERQKLLTGNFTLEFICEPYQYFENNTIVSTGNSISIYNPYIKALPKIKITGEGLVNFTINDKTFKVQVGQNITIDSSLELCYRVDGTINNIALSGRYPILQPGINNLSWNTTGSIIKVEIETNWRCL